MEKQIAILSEELLYSLYSNRLEVALIDAPEPKHMGHKIRIAIDHNPTWYSDFYHSLDIKISRREVIKGLITLVDSKGLKGAYYFRLRDLIIKFLNNGYDSINGFVPPKYK